MPIFRFRFETLLRVRRSERDAQSRRMAEVQAVRRSLDEQQAQSAARQRDEQQRMRRLGASGKCDVDAMLASQRFLATVQAELRELAQRTAQVEEELRHRRTELAEADRRVRVIEKLRERDWQHHRHVELQLEQKRLDEAGQRESSISEP